MTSSPRILGKSFAGRGHEAELLTQSVDSDSTLSRDLDKGSLKEAASNLKRQKKAVEAQLTSLPRPRAKGLETIDPERLGLVCSRVAAWLAAASEEQCAQVLEALQINVQATR